MPDRQSQTLLITGATGGMGSASAKMAASRGDHLILSDLDGSKLEQLAEQCRNQDVTVKCLPLDVTDSDAIDRFVAEINRGSGVDAVIHTLGLSPQMASWDKIIEVDLVGTVELLEKLRDTIKPGGCAVCIASMSGHMVPPHAEVQELLSEPRSPGLIERVQLLDDPAMENSGMAYAYAKKALISYVVKEAMAWGKEGKRLVSLSPGLIDTDMGRLEADSDSDTYAAMRQMVALQRDGMPSEIASVALFLASDQASYITGCDLLVDGGFVASFLSSQRLTTP